MRKYFCNVSTRLPEEVMDKIDNQVNAGRFKNVSTAVAKCAETGLQVLEYQEMMKDPAKAKEFIKKMQEILQEDQLIEWSQTLTAGQLDSFIMLLRMEKDNRYKQQRFV